ncbi:hypothetical protein J6590_101808, partial [Homalodisca vitripennis]
MAVTTVNPYNINELTSFHKDGSTVKSPPSQSLPTQDPVTTGTTYQLLISSRSSCRGLIDSTQQTFEQLN